MSARTYEGPALFSYGFRPFFLLGSIYAGFAILVWLPVFMGELSWSPRSFRATGTSMKCSTASCRR